MADYYVIPTNIGEAKMANALALGIPLAITELALGDGEGAGAKGTPIPNPEAISLVSERRRAPINSFSVDPANSNVLVAEQIIPEDHGGWWIREMGLFDEDGDLIFVCNTPPTYKPQLSEGSGRTQVVRMAAIVSDSASVSLKVDPSVVLATKKYVDQGRLKIANSEETLAADNDSLAVSPVGLKQAISAALDKKWPQIESEEWIFNNECESLDDWSYVVGANGAYVNGSSIVLPETGSELRLRTPASLPTQYDYILYLSAACEVSPGHYSTLRLNDGVSGYILSIAFGYDWAAGASEVGAISAGVSGGEKVKLASGVDYSRRVDLAMHVDRKYDQISFYQRVDGNWFYLGSIAYFLAIENVAAFDLQNTLGGGFARYDFISVARPAVMVIGDSIAAGSRGFNPDPSVWPGLDNYNSTWQRHARVFQGLRNNLVVNKGVGGDTSADILARISEVTSIQPGVVFLHASTNDEHNGLSLTQRTQNIQDTVDAIVSSGSKCILLNAIYANNNNGHFPEEPDFNRTWWETELGKINGIAMAIDTMHSIKDGNGYIDNSFADADGVHPNVPGYRRIGRYIESKENI